MLNLNSGQHHKKHNKSKDYVVLDGADWELKVYFSGNRKRTYSGEAYPEATPY